LTVAGGFPNCIGNECICIACKQYQNLNRVMKDCTIFCFDDIVYCQYNITFSMKHIDHNITFTIPGRQTLFHLTTYKGNIYCRQKSSSIRIMQTYSYLTLLYRERTMNIYISLTCCIRILKTN
jgi:hypothetical protein